MADLSHIITNMRVVEVGGWSDVILNIEKIPKVFFVETNTESDPLLRLNSVVRLYEHRENPEEYFNSLPAQNKCSYPLSPETDLHQLVETVNRQLSPEAHLQRHLPKISVIFEEMAMNGVRSSVKSRTKNGTSFNTSKPSAEMFLVWDNASLWIHCIDDLGSFKRKFLPGSFKEYDGSQGFGMKLIFESSHDLFISSIPDKHTWFAARIGTYLSNLKFDREFKVLCVDCPNE